MANFMVHSSAGGLVSLLHAREIDDDDDDDAHLHTPTPPPEEAERLVVKHKHQCATCSKTFTTSGHLSRHNKVHTGVKDNVCPWPGCDKRCGRQDNLIQHYRMHLPKPDRKSTHAYVRERIQEMRERVGSRSEAELDEGDDFVEGMDGSPRDATGGSPRTPSLVSSEGTLLMETTFDRPWRTLKPITISPGASGHWPTLSPSYSNSSPVLHGLIGRSSSSTSKMCLPEMPTGRSARGPGYDFGPTKNDRASASRMVVSPTSDRHAWPPVSRTMENYERYRLSNVRGE